LKSEYNKTAEMAGMSEKLNEIDLLDQCDKAMGNYTREIGETMNCTNEPISKRISWKIPFSSLIRDLR
jgi:hypothetical protein